MNTVTRSTSAVAVAAAMVGVGVLSACSSNSTAETTPSPTDTRAAGLLSTKETRLTVLNKTGQDLPINTLDVVYKSPKQPPLTPENTTKATVSGTQSLKPGASTQAQGVRVGFAVVGSQADIMDSFTAHNPPTKYPYVLYKAEAPGTGTWQIEDFSENQVFNWTSPATGRKYEIKRGSDSDYKEFTITVR